MWLWIILIFEITSRYYNFLTAKRPHQSSLKRDEWGCDAVATMLPYGFGIPLAGKTCFQASCLPHNINT